MGMSIRTNSGGNNSCRILKKTSKKNDSVLEKLASGYQINKAGDDASGLAITEKMRAQINALNTISPGCEDGVNLVKTADGYLGEMQEMVVRMVELTEKSANGILDDETDRAALQLEVDHLGAEIDRIADTANFNQNKLFNGGSVTYKAKETIRTNTPIKFSDYLCDRENIAQNKGEDAVVFLSKEIDNYVKNNGINPQSIIGKTIYYSDDLQRSFIADKNADPDTIKSGLGFTAQDTNTAYSSTEIGKAYGSYRISTVPPFIDNDDEFGSQTAALIDGAINTYKANFQSLSCLEDKLVYYAKDGSGAIVESSSKSSVEIMTQLGGKDYYSAGMTLTTSMYILRGNAEITVDRFKDKTIPLQIGETSNKADKLVINLYDMHTDKLFKPIESYIKTGEKVSVITTPNKPSKYWGVSGNMDGSSAIASGGSSGSSTSHTVTYETYQAVTLNAIKVNTDTSAYPNAVTLDISTQENAIKNIDYVKSVSEHISLIRSDYGAKQNRLEKTINNIENAAENISAAKSRIKDTDMAKMMIEHTKNNILQQSAQAMLAQANTQAQSTISLLQ